MAIADFGNHLVSALARLRLFPVSSVSSVSSVCAIFSSFSFCTLTSLIALLYSSSIAAAAAQGMYLPGPDESRRLHRAKDGENFYRGETEADRLYREANRARFDLEPEKARSLFEEAQKAEGSMRAKIKSRICLKCYLPKYPVTPECEKLFKQADLLVEDNKLADGLAAFQTLETKYPKFEWAELGLATIHLKNDDPERAATCARRALIINPNYVDAWMILTHDCLMHHDMEGARITTETAHELDPYSDIVSKTINLIDAELAKKQPD
jgi:tetratricopeptide (TPR) repeat protein